MSNTSIAIDYTDRVYLSRNELQGALGTSLIDGYWNDIVAYRAKYAKKLPFRTITNIGFFYTSTPEIELKINTLSQSFLHLVNVIKKMDPGMELTQTERLIKLVQLKAVSSFTVADMDDLSLKALLNGTYRSDNPSHESVVSYLATLNKCLNKEVSAADDNFLGFAYGELLGDPDEMNSFYRTSDFDMSAKRASYAINSDYTYAPFQYIEDLMNEFFNFLTKSEAPLLIKALASIYYLDYIRPFDEKNDELGVLLGLDLLANSELSREAFYLPLATLLVKNGTYKNLFYLVQRSGDLTYFLQYAVVTLTPLLESLEKDIQEIQLSRLRAESKPLAPSEAKVAFKEEATSKVPEEQMSLFEEKEPVAPAKETVAPVAPTPEAPTKEAPVDGPSKEEGKPESAPIEKPVEVAPAPSEIKPEVVAKAPKKNPVPVISGLSLESLKEQENPLSDKEVKEYVQYLLESNPNLNKNQASFLASHCSLNHYYSIQQFKKYTHCAYETARTSMDKLAEQKYYEKLNVKNKFVYRPLKQGENK